MFQEGWFTSFSCVVADDKKVGVRALKKDGEITEWWSVYAPNDAAERLRFFSKEWGVSLKGEEP